MLNLTQLIGFGVGGDSAPDFTLSFVDSATSGGANITIPATAQEGDICILVDTALNVSTTTPTSVIPTGFTSITNVTGTTTSPLNYRRRTIVSYKKLASGDAGTSITGLNAQSESKTMAVFRSVDIPTTLTLFSVAGQSVPSGTNPSPSTLTASTAPYLAIGWSAVLNLSTTPTPDGEVNASNDIHYFLFNEEPASDVTVDVGTAASETAAFGRFGIRLS